MARSSGKKLVCPVSSDRVPRHEDSRALKSLENSMSGLLELANVLVFCIGASGCRMETLFCDFYDGCSLCMALGSVKADWCQAGVGTTAALICG